METVSEVIVDHGFELQCCFGRFLMRQSKSVNVEKGNEKDLTSFCLHLSHAERAKNRLSRSWAVLSRGRDKRSMHVNENDYVECCVTKVRPSELPSHLYSLRRDKRRGGLHFLCDFSF